MKRNEARTAARTEADRLKLESDSRMAAAGAEADRLKRENDAQRAASQAELDSAAKQKAQLEAEKVELRAQLLKQFNAILQTRDTARGLIVNMSDVLFDTAKYSLRPLAREKLAKVAGIVSGHPGLRLDVEGHTDSVGGDDYNQQLSEQRGEAVRDYLTQQGMAASSVTAKGFGKTQPVASNDTAQGRQQNRRVELVISGEVIGTEIGGAPRPTASVLVPRWPGRESTALWLSVWTRRCIRTRDTFDRAARGSGAGRDMRSVEQSSRAPIAVARRCPPGVLAAPTAQPFSRTCGIRTGSIRRASGLSRVP